MLMPKASLTLASALLPLPFASMVRSLVLMTPLPLTAALVELKLEEHDLLYNTQIFIRKTGSPFRLGNFTIEFIHVNHSIPDSVALAIGTPVGTVVHTGDFKVDYSPIDGGIIDLGRFGELGSRGVLALMADSTNAERAGYTPTERKVGESFKVGDRECRLAAVRPLPASLVAELDA